MWPHLHQRAADFDAGNDPARDRARRDARRSFAGGGAPAAAIVAHAIFRVIDIVCVARPVDVFDGVIVFRALVGVFDQERDRRSGRDLSPRPRILKYAREDFDRVRLLPLRREPASGRGGGDPERPEYLLRSVRCAADSHRRRSRSPARGSRQMSSRGKDGRSCYGTFVGAIRVGERKRAALTPSPA